MKIRNGFVSNSSSSSFVLLGIVIDNNIFSQKDYIEKVYKQELLEDEDIDDKFYDERSSSDFYIGLSTDDGAPEGKHIIGKRFIINDDRTSYIYNLKKEIKEIKKILKELRMENVEISLIAGTYYC